MTQIEAPHRQRRVREVAEAAAYIVTHMFGDQRSVIDPSRVIWSRRPAEEIRTAILSADESAPKNQYDRLVHQLRSASREAILFAAEALYLRSLPLENVNPDTKRGYVTRMLDLLGDTPEIPSVLQPGFDVNSYHGGLSYNQTAWKQLVWIADFVIHWWEQPEATRSAALGDPWEFRKIVAGVEDDFPLMRNAFLAMVYPDVFESTTGDGDKKKIRDAFAHEIGGPSGDSSEDVDRDLWEIRKKIEKPGGPKIDWWEDFWHVWGKKPAAGGDDGAGRAWLVKTGPGGRERINAWLSDGYVSLDGSHFPQNADQEWEKADVRDAVADGYEHVDYVQRTALTDDYYAFLRQLAPGDLVVARDGAEAWVGEVSSEYRFATGVPKLRRDVDWITEPFSMDDLPDQIPSLLTTARFVVDLTETYDSLKAMLDELDSVEPPSDERDAAEPDSPVRLEPASQELSEQLNIDQPWLDQVIDLLQTRKQIILYGPPGTGKTYLALEIAKHAASDESVRVVQFHPSYAYEDFFEGFRPQKLDDGSFGFDLVPGPLRDMASQAGSNPDTAYVLIIDEINRANIAKVFGELYFLLEYRDERIELQYSAGQRFALPENLFIIGTMNTADRSIAMVDAAIRRRFSFIEMHPATEPVASLLRRWLKTRGVDDERAALLDALNQEIEEHDFKIGPSYLMRSEAETPEGLERIWDFDILPLLDEHYYGRLSRDQIRSRFGLTALLKKTRRSEDPPAVAVSDDEDGDEAPVP